MKTPVPSIRHAKPDRYDPDTMTQPPYQLLSYADRPPPRVFPIAATALGAGVAANVIALMLLLLFRVDFFLEEAWVVSVAAAVVLGIVTLRLTRRRKDAAGRGLAYWGLALGL